MITDNIQDALRDIVSRVRAIPAFSNRVSLVVGGNEIDPINRDLHRPYAWIIFTGDEQVSSSANNCLQVNRLDFIIKLVTDYGNEEDMITTHLPLLYDVQSNIIGGEPIPGSHWEYQRTYLDQLDSNRMVWEQQYSLNVTVGAT